MEIMLDKKANSSDFLEFKMGRKAVESTCSISSAFGPGIANQRTVEWSLKKFCKGDETLEGNEYSGWPSEVDADQLRAIIEADPLTIEKLPKNPMSAILPSFDIRSKLER